MPAAVGALFPFLYFSVSLVEKKGKTTLPPSKMSSDDVPLDDPLSASALLDVRLLAHSSLLPQKGKKRKGQESCEREKERREKHQKFSIFFFLGNRARLTFSSTSFSTTTTITPGLFHPHQQHQPRTALFLPGRDPRRVRLRELRPGL